MQSKRFQHAADACDDSKSRSHIDLGNRPGVPDGSDDLLVELKTLIWTVDAGLGPTADYAECMHAADITTDVKLGGWQDFYKFLTARRPRPPLPGGRPSQAWRDYLEFEKSALAADARCRVLRYEMGLAILKPSLDAFEADHADEIATIEAGWADTVAKAQSLGFTLE